jgi:hypothetical protein
LKFIIFIIYLCITIKTKKIMWWRFLKNLLDTFEKNEKFFFHLFSFIGACIFSYFFVPSNLVSPGSILVLLIANFIVVELMDWMKKSRKKD